MGKSNYLFLFVLLIGFSAYSQKTSDTDVEFKVERAAMWEPGSNFTLDNRFPLFPQINWNESVNTKGDGITQILEAKFGAGIEAEATGSLGMEFYIEGFTAGEIDISYPINVKLTLPDDSTFSPGSIITINSEFAVNNGWSLTSRYPSAGRVGLDLIMGMSLEADAEICLGGCSTFPIVPRLNLPVSTIPLFKVSTIPGDPSFYPCPDNNPLNTAGFTFCTVTPPRPYPYELPNLPVSGFIDLPLVQTIDRLENKIILADGNHNYFQLDLDIIDMLALIKGPVGVFFDALKEEIELGSVTDATGTTRTAKVEYALFTTNFIFNVTNNQRFKFEPKVFTKIGLPVVVEYQEVTVDGIPVGNPGKSDTIKFQVGNNVNIRFPCDYDFMDIGTEISMTNRFSNRTFDSFSGEIALSALSFGIDIPKFVVVPEFCTPRVCVFGGCVGPICTPEVASPSFGVDLGPVWSKSVPLFTVDVNYFDRAWEVPGFNNNIPGNGFRLTPKTFKTDLLAQNVNCFGDSTGSVSVNVQSGTAPFSYRWSDGDESTSPVLTDVPAGNYYVKVTDANQCTALGTTEVTENPELKIEHSIDKLLCYQDTDASVNIEVSGGIGDYSYLWSNGSVNRNATGLSSGEVSVEVRDDSSCVITDTFEIQEPTELRVLLAKKENPACFGENTGSIAVEAYGGSQPLRYSWNTGEVLPKARNLTSGTYEVTITDSNNCVTSLSETITDPELLVSNINVVKDVSCKEGSDGTLQLVISGGTNPKRVEWFKSENKLSDSRNTISNLSAGTYLAIVTDAKNCVSQSSQVVSQPTESLSVNFSKKDVTCYRGADGEITSFVNGGTSPYSFSWSSGGDTKNQTGLSFGRHNLTITDAQGCELTDGVFLFQDDPIKIDFNTLSTSCFETEDGQIISSVSGGKLPYSYSWSTGSTEASISDLPEGDYELVVTDSSGCIETASTYVERVDQPCFFIPSAFSPNGDEVNDTWIIRSSESFPDMEVKIYNKWSNEIFSSNGYEKPWDGTWKGKEVTPGTYYYVIDLKDGSEILTGPLSIIRNE